MKKSSFYILLILTSWTLSLEAQSNDTTKCYGITDLRKIAIALTKGQECDTLLKLSNLQIANRDSAIILLNKSIVNLKTESALKEAIISRKQQEVDTINLQLKHTKRQLFWTKMGWLATALGTVSLTTYFAIH